MENSNTFRREKKQLEITFPFLAWESENVTFPPHWHDCFEILLLTKGGMYISVDDALYEASAGDVVMINAGAVHGFFDAKQETAILGMQFGITFFDEVFITLRDMIFQNPLILSDRRIQPLLRETAREYRRKDIGYQLAVKSKLYEFMALTARNAPKIPEKKLSSRSKQILAFVFKHFDDPDLTLEDGANALSLTKFYFTRFFKKHTGYSFHSYLTKTRVDFAKRYLIESKMTITEVAFRAGFNSLQTFNRVFKNLTGFVPRDYRRENSIPTSRFENKYLNTEKRKN
ncbi:MAG: AraC family transcriptional regulator [Spirochaetaceae bacterium]|jgi:AraC-like DNA-binding protein|nr:AraC family transcriptional regulator [Spirochaetaceae bacterium]